jgi:hypothetical protein
MVNEEVTPDVLQVPLAVPQAQQQRADESSRAVLVPPEAGDDTVGGALVLDLGHRPLPRGVRIRRSLGDHAVEAGTLEHLEPSLCDGRIGGRGGELDRFGGIADELLEALTPLTERGVAQVIGSIGQAVEGDEGGGRLLGQHLHA